MTAITLETTCRAATAQGSPIGFASPFVQKWSSPSRRNVPVTRWTKNHPGTVVLQSDFSCRKRITSPVEMSAVSTGKWITTSSQPIAGSMLPVHTSSRGEAPDEISTRSGSPCASALKIGWRLSHFASNVW